MDIVLEMGLVRLDHTLMKVKGFVKSVVITVGAAKILRNAKSVQWDLKLQK